MEITNQNTCKVCGYMTYKQIDDRKFCEVGNLRKSPITKCLGCGYSVENCICLMLID